MSSAMPEAGIQVIKAAVVLVVPPDTCLQLDKPTVSEEIIFI